jgi:hypothetical protein
MEKNNILDNYTNKTNYRDRPEESKYDWEKIYNLHKEKQQLKETVKEPIDKKPKKIEKAKPKLKSR